jgi:YQGE family putative transporter
MLQRLNPNARTVLFLSLLYHTADALCSVFVSVYLYKKSLDFQVVCIHYLVIYAVVPVFFLLAGWYAQVRDRTHVARFGLFLHVVYYSLILYLQDDAPDYAVPLGALLGVTFGFFWAGFNTFNFDFTKSGERDYYFGLLTALRLGINTLGPFAAGVLIGFMPSDDTGYLVVFGLAVVLYTAAMIYSFRIPSDATRRPFEIKRALFPPRVLGDWRKMMLAAFTIAGAYHLFYVLLGLLMYLETENEFLVGSYTAIQGLVGIVMAVILGRILKPSNRWIAMLAGTILLLAAGSVVFAYLSVTTLVIFVFLRALSLPLFSVPHSAVMLSVVEKSVREPYERIEFICALEVPLAIGRVFFMICLMGLFHLYGTWGIQIVLVMMCVSRLGTYLLVTGTDVMKEDRKGLHDPAQ